MQIELERAIVLAHSLLVRAIVPDDANHGVGHRLLITVEHIARDGDFQVGLHEAVDVVVATGVVAVGAEEAALALPESDAEVIAGRVHRHSHILHVPAARRCLSGFEEVEPSHSGVTV